MPEDFSDKQKLMSDFNEAGFQIYRLHKLWEICNDMANPEKVDYCKYKFTLDRIWVELSADAKQKDKEKYFGEIKILNEKIAKNKNRDELYQALQEKEIFLKCLQDDVGKGSKKSSFHEHM